MRLAAQRHGAYGGECLRAGLRLRAQGGRKEAKNLIKLGKNGATYETTGSTAADKISTHAPWSRLPFIAASAA
jgi:hypothetical protein